MKKKLSAVIVTVILLIPLFSNYIFSEKISNSYATNISHNNILINHKEADKPFTMLWFTDTQYYAESNPIIYDFLGDWLVKEYRRGTFGYIINTGDIVNVASRTDQWEVASRNFKKLDDSNIPYGLVAGNHDVSIKGLNYSRFVKYFGESRYKGKPWYGGNINNNCCHYDLVSFGSHNFIVLYLGYNTVLPQKTINWANNTLKKHSNRTAILALHEYLESNGNLAKTAKSIFNNIVIKNDNVTIVLCGHNHCARRNVRIITRPDGKTRKVLEILSDYQNAPHGGDGYLRYLSFDPAQEKLKVVTYSPYINDYNFFDDSNDSFTESISLKH